MRIDGKFKAKRSRGVRSEEEGSSVGRVFKCMGEVIRLGLTGIVVGCLLQQFLLDGVHAGRLFSCEEHGLLIRILEMHLLKFMYCATSTLLRVF